MPLFWERSRHEISIFDVNQKRIGFGIILQPIQLGPTVDTYYSFQPYPISINLMSPL